jgi:predicted nucleic acid-binding protein
VGGSGLIGAFRGPHTDVAVEVARARQSRSPPALACHLLIARRACRGPLRVISDTGRLVAAANRRDQAHGLAAALVTELRRDLLLPEPVIVEADQLLRSRVGSQSARLFLASIAAGEHSVVNVSPRLLQRAVELDTAFADLDLGYTDAAVMALAEREHLPVLTRFRAFSRHASRPRFLAASHRRAPPSRQRSILTTHPW